MRVFITGASSGIGAALSRAFAARGDTLGLVARNPDKLASFVKTLPFAEKHVPYAVDVTDRTDLLAAARDFEAKGETDIVIACAGISIGVKTEYFEDLDVLERIYKTNVFAMASTFHGFIAPMKSRGRGQFVGIGSVAGLMSGDVELVGRSMRDVVAEPHRKRFIPGFDSLRDAVLEAGALAMNISGAGPSVFALSSSMETAARVGEVMKAHFADRGISSDIYVSKVSNRGARVLND